MVADAICYWKMTSFMALDGVPSFLRSKDVTYTPKRMRRSLKYWREFLSAMAERWKSLKASNVFSAFIVCKY